MSGVKEPLRRILLVEDDPDIQTIAKASLESVGGFEVRVCGQAEKAVREAAEFLPQMILLDIMMPVMDGPMVLRALKKHDACRGIPVVFMTAKVQDEDTGLFKDQEIAGVIGKPFDPMTLSRTVNALWERFQSKK